MANTSLACLDEIVTWDDTAIYRVNIPDGTGWKVSGQYSGRPSNNIPLNNPSYLLGFNAEPNNGTGPNQEYLVDLSLRGGNGVNAPVTSGRYEIFFDLDKVTALRVGSGVVCEICYNLSTIIYECELKTNVYTDLSKAKTTWNTSKTQYENVLKNGTSQFHADAESKRRTMESNYINYLNQLRTTLKAIQEKEETYYAL